MCVCERERERECVCKRERERVCALSACVCVYVCVCAGERESLVTVLEVSDMSYTFALDAGRSSLKLERFGGLSLAAGFQFLLHKPMKTAIERPNNMQMSRGNSAGLFRSRDTTTSNYNVSLGHCFLDGIVTFFFVSFGKKRRKPVAFKVLLRV